MIIHVEGTDGTGKSTLVPALADTLRLRIMPSEGPAKGWTDCVDRVQKRLVDGIICDRSSGLISELVYGRVIRGELCEAEYSFWLMVGHAIGKGVIFVYCRPPAELIQPNFFDDEDPKHVAGVKEQAAELLVRYDEVMLKVKAFGGKVVKYDRTRMTYSDLVTEILACAA